MKPDQAFTILANAIKKTGEPICMQTDPDQWFPEVGGLNGDARAAKKLCNECPVKRECLQFAIVNNELYGIWGGLSYRERMRVKNPNRTLGRPRANALNNAK